MLAGVGPQPPGGSCRGSPAEQQEERIYPLHSVPLALQLISGLGTNINASEVLKLLFQDAAIKAIVAVETRVVERSILLI
jgi:hypothetical protein